MIPTNTELYSNPYYFFLRERSTHFDLYFSSEQTLTEARKKDEMIKVPKEKVELVKKYLKKLEKSDKKKSTGEMKNELEELVTLDGSMSNSKVPILDPLLHPRKTMDQTVPAATITNDPISRGYRVYYGESVEEEDLSKAFGYQETSGKTPVQTVKILKKMGVDNPIERAEEFGKSVKLNKKKKKGTEMRIRLTEKEKIQEIQRKKMIKVVEDMLVKNKKTDDFEVGKKDSLKSIEDLPPTIKKNLKSLLKQVHSNGMSKSDLIKILKSEQ